MKEWLKKSYPYILTALVVCGILGYYRGLYSMVTALMLWSMMIMVVEFSYRQPKHERRLIRIMTLVVILILGFSCLHSFGMGSPVNALSLDYEFEDTQIIWTWNRSEERRVGKGCR